MWTAYSKKWGLIDPVDPAAPVNWRKLTTAATSVITGQYSLPTLPTIYSVQSVTMLSGGGWYRADKKEDGQICAYATSAPISVISTSTTTLQALWGPLSLSLCRPLMPTITHIQQDLWTYILMPARAVESRRHTMTWRATLLCAPTLPWTRSHPPSLWSLKTAS